MTKNKLPGLELVEEPLKRQNPIEFLWNVGINWDVENCLPDCGQEEQTLEKGVEVAGV